MDVPERVPLLPQDTQLLQRQFSPAAHRDRKRQHDGQQQQLASGIDLVGVLFFAAAIAFCYNASWR